HPPGAAGAPLHPRPRQADPEPAARQAAQGPRQPLAHGAGLRPPGRHRALLPQRDGAGPLSAGKQGGRRRENPSACRPLPRPPSQGQTPRRPAVVTRKPQQVVDNPSLVGLLSISTLIAYSFSPTAPNVLARLVGYSVSSAGDSPCPLPCAMPAPGTG